MHYLNARSMKQLKTFSQRGDTIVEVMIVLAVLSFAIIISYASANRSLADARQSEENSYAAELAQSQIEQIRGMVISAMPTSTGNISTLNVSEMSGNPFCMSSGAPLSASTPSCQPTIPVGGTPYTITDTLSQPVPSLPAQDHFEVQVTWPDALGHGQDIVTLFYEVSPPPPPSPTS
jgi:type II secretory pathway pseudopilin PulG